MAERETTSSLHVVVGWPGRSKAASSALRARTKFDLIASQHPSDGYSVEIAVEGDGEVIRCSFANKDDADRLAATVSATVVASYPAYRSQRVFVLDQNACDVITDLIRERQQGQEERSHAPAGPGASQRPGL